MYHSGLNYVFYFFYVAGHTFVTISNLYTDALIDRKNYLTEDQSTAQKQDTPTKTSATEDRATINIFNFFAFIIACTLLFITDVY